MRTAEELITELDEVASDVDKAALVIDCQGKTVYADANDPDNLDVLRDALARGGRLFGYIKYDLGSVGVLPLQEYSGEDGVLKYLQTLAEDLAYGQGFDFLIPRTRRRPKCLSRRAPQVISRKGSAGT
jgi:hypothetical protein